jgi:exopolysaccharide production protein ExoZ
MIYVFWNVPGGWLPPFRYAGFAGVDAFFVISGFIIFTVCGRLTWAGSNITTAAEFFLRRVFRVYPVYWLFFLFYGLLIESGVEHAFVAGWKPGSIYDFFLFNRYNQQLLPAWTLVYEMLFYAVASASLLFGRQQYRLILAAWIGAEVILSTLNYFVPFGAWQQSILLNPLLIEFGMGCCVGWLVQRKERRFGGIAAIAWIPFYVVGGYLAAQGMTVNGDSYIRVLTFGVGSALLVYAVCVAEWRGRIAPWWMITIGNASYSIYLGHEVTLFATRYASWQLGVSTAIGGWLTLLAALLATIGMGLVSYRFFERPMTAFLHGQIKLMLRKPTTTAT